ncbi:hypothetical protein CSKR_104986, partial [Clonorchis sinensis]
AQSPSFRQPYVLLELSLHGISEIHSVANIFGSARDSPGTQLNLSFMMLLKNKINGRLSWCIASIHVLRYLEYRANWNMGRPGAAHSVTWKHHTRGIQLGSGPKKSETGRGLSKNFQQPHERRITSIQCIVMSRMSDQVKHEAA